jgi:hypothetical protein
MALIRLICLVLVCTLSHSVFAENTDHAGVNDDSANFMDGLLLDPSENQSPAANKPALPNLKDNRRQQENPVVSVTLKIQESKTGDNSVIKAKFKANKAKSEPTITTGQRSPIVDTSLPDLNSESEVAPAALECKTDQTSTRASFIVVPPEESSETKMPRIDPSALKYMAEKGLDTDFPSLRKKLKEVLGRISKISGHIKKDILSASEAFGIDPLHIIGPIAAEHTFNVNVIDNLQDTYIRRLQQWKSALNDRDSENKINELLNRREFKICYQFKTKYDFWMCVIDNYSTKILKRKRNLSVGYNRHIQPSGSALIYEYFIPTGGGKTYGLGQLSPLRAIMVSDLVHEIRPDFPLVDETNFNAAYEAVLNPESAVYYVAATSFINIETYKKYSGFDVSQNPGLVATLYNLGDEYYRASTKEHENLKATATGDIVFPEVNAFGWFINRVAPLLREWLNEP